MHAAVAKVAKSPFPRRRPASRGFVATCRCDWTPKTGRPDLLIEAPEIFALLTFSEERGSDHDDNGGCRHYEKPVALAIQRPQENCGKCGRGDDG